MTINVRDSKKHGKYVIERVRKLLWFTWATTIVEVSAESADAVIDEVIAAFNETGKYHVLDLRKLHAPASD